MLANCLLVLLGACSERSLEVRSDGPISVEQAVLELQALDDPVARTARVEELLIDGVIGGPAALCDELPAGPARERCRAMGTRPHLWGQPGAEEEDHALKRALKRSLPASRLEPGEAWEPACEEGIPLSSCATSAARELARGGRSLKAARICLSVDLDKWGRECMFRAAEGRLDAADEDAYGEAVDLCLLAGSFVDPCLDHLVLRLASSSPGATDNRSVAWAPLLAARGTIHRRWSDEAPEHEERQAGRFWAEVARASYAEVPKVSGDAFDHLPEEAHPHLRAGGAWRLLALRDRRGDTLEGLVSVLRQSLAARVGEPSHRSKGPPPIFAGDLWTERLPEEEALRQLLCLGTERRVLLEDPGSDLAVCLLEAAARTKPPRLRLLTDAHDHPDARVRWTALRLLSQRGPPTALGLFAADEHPLVQARLRHRAEKHGERKLPPRSTPP